VDAVVTPAGITGIGARTRLPWWSDSRQAREVIGSPSKKPVSVLSLFRVVIAVRWAALVLLPVQVGVGSDAGTAGRLVWAGIAVAAVYTALLTVLSKKVLALHLSGPVFWLGDLALMAALFATGHGTSWPFFLFGTTTILLPGLWGSIAAGMVAALAWNALMILATLLRGEPVSHVLGIHAIEDVFNLGMMAAIWSYCARVALRLEAAHADLTENRDALEQANRALDDREKEILGLLDVGAAMLGKREVTDMLRVVLDGLTGMGFGRCRVWLLNGDRLEVIAGSKELPSVPAGSDEPLAAAVRGRGTRTRGAGEPGRFPGVDPGALVMAVPIVTSDETLGAMVVESVSGEPFTDDERELLELLADQIALAVRHVLFGEQGRELAVAEERSRITHEIHDTVVQKIYGASLLAGALRSRDFSPAVAEKIRLLEETTLMSLKDLRFAVLRWDSLEWSGAPAELAERYVQEFAMLSGISSAFSTSGGDCRLGASRAQDLLRILQGTLSNVWRHACATSVGVEMTLGEGGVDLSITDDGRGYTPDPAGAPPDTDIGRMMSRCTRNGGKMTVTSACGEGTVVNVWMPCQGGAQ
jgi:signal transduction histidine kinase